MGLLDELKFDELQVNPLFQMGLGILANSSRPRGSSPWSAVGQGAMQGVQNLAATKKGMQDQELHKMQIDQLKLMQPLQLQQLQSSVADAKARQVLNTILFGNLGFNLDGSAKISDSAPGLSPSSAAAFGRPDLATPDVPSKTAISQNALSRIPAESVLLELANNGGKELGKMVYEANKPNMQFHNGVAFDMNSIKPGVSVPSMSQNGQASQLIPDPTVQGGYRVTTPPGALESYGAFRNADEAAKAGYDVTTHTGVRGNPVTTTRKAIVDAINKPNLTEQDQAAITAYNAAGRPGPDKPFSITMDGPKGIPTQSPAGASYQGDQAKDFSKQMTNIQNAGFTADSKISKYTELARLYGDYEGGKLSGTAMNMAQLGNSLGLKLDKNLPNKEAAIALSREMALALRNPSGGAGMPGSLSDSDRNYLESMTPQLGQTAEGRKMVVNAAIAIEQRNKDIAKFARKYEQKYGQLDNGFYDQLGEWAKQNPLFGGR